MLKSAISGNGVETFETIETNYQERKELPSLAKGRKTGDLQGHSRKQQKAPLPGCLSIYM